MKDDEKKDVHRKSILKDRQQINIVINECKKPPV